MEDAFYTALHEGDAHPLSASDGDALDAGIPLHPRRLQSNHLYGHCQARIQHITVDRILRFLGVTDWCFHGVSAESAWHTWS